MKRPADSPPYFLAFTVGMIALITLLNAVGLNTGKWLNNLGAIGEPNFHSHSHCLRQGISFLRFGSATHFTWSAMVPKPGMKNLIFLSTIFFALGGLRVLRSCRSMCPQLLPDRISHATNRRSQSPDVSGMQ